MSPTAIGLACLALYAATTTGGTSQDGDQAIDIKRAWSGTLPLASISLLPKDQRASRLAIIDHAETWSKIWRAHQPDKPQPDVDFGTHVVVLIKNVRYFNRITLVSSALQDGRLTLRAKETRSARPVAAEVYCLFVVVPREGVLQVSDGRSSRPMPRP